MPMIFAITHGKRFSGFNPKHKEAGLKEIEDLVRKCPFLARAPVIVTGTGIRFVEIGEVLKKVFPELREAPLKRDKICGGPQARDDPAQIGYLTDGSCCSLEEYARATYVSVEDIWLFLETLPDQTIICTGRQLIQALGVQSESAKLFEIDRERRFVLKYN